MLIIDYNKNSKSNFYYLIFLRCYFYLFKFFLHVISSSKHM